MKLHRILASGLGSGYLRPAPGTWGSLVGIIPALFLPTTILPLFLAVLFFAGVWASDKFARESGVKDPQSVVIDEVLGMGVGLLFLPKTLLFYAAAFILFRMFDIKKPWIIRKLEHQPGGWGIMLDDLAAGVLANLILQLAVRVFILLKFSL